jgi:hypothetical protein
MSSANNINIGSIEGAASMQIGRQSSPLEHQLLKLNVNEHTEKKQNLTYLSWAWAWAEALKADPAANFEVQQFDGKPYIDVNGTAMVVVAVRIQGIVRTCHLPVMNSSNQPISIEGRKFKDKYGNEKVEKLDSFNLNTAIMRCMTKCLALFGLGLYIYAGEDLPEGDEEMKPVAKEEEKKAPEVTTQETANLTLFANSMLEYIHIAKDEKGLRSYWKSNQTTIDVLKAKLPDEYSRILAAFQEAKATMTKGESNE